MTHPPNTPGRVFLVQEPLHIKDGVPVPRIGYHTLRPYGEVRFLFSWGELTDRTDLSDTHALLTEARRQLADFSDADYLVPMGNPVLIALATLAAAEANEGRVKMLDWLREERRYRVGAIDLDDPRDNVR